MKMFIFIAVSLMPIAAQAQVDGVRLVYCDPTPITQGRPHGRIFVGDSLVGLTAEETTAQACLYNYSGAKRKDLPYGAVRCATFAGEHLYLASMLKGVICLATSDWQEAGCTTVPRPDYVAHLGATRDGHHVILVKAMVPDSIEFYSRNPESGALTRKQVYQPDEEALVYDRTLAQQSPEYSFEIDPQAVRLPSLNLVSDMTITESHGETLFLASESALLAFDRDEKWKHVATAKDGKQGIISMGLIRVFCVGGHENHVFLAGRDSLSWFEFDGNSLACRQWWVDKESGFEGVGNFRSWAMSVR